MQLTCRYLCRCQIAGCSSASFPLKAGLNGVLEWPTQWRGFDNRMDETEYGGSKFVCILPHLWVRGDNSRPFGISCRP